MKLFLSSIVLTMAFLSSGCLTRNVPKAPVITMYLYDAPSQVAMCSRTNGEKCERRDIHDMDKFIMLSYQDWTSINDYVDALILAVKNPNAPDLPVLQSIEAQGQRDDLYRALIELKKTLDSVRF